MIQSESFWEDKTVDGKKTGKKDREAQNIIVLLSALAIVIALVFIVLRGDLIN